MLWEESIFIMDFNDDIPFAATNETELVAKTIITSLSGTVPHPKAYMSQGTTQVCP